MSAAVTDAVCVVASVVQQQTTTAAAAVFACDSTKDSYQRPTAAATTTTTTSRAYNCYKSVEQFFDYSSEFQRIKMLKEKRQERKRQ